MDLIKYLVKIETSTIVILILFAVWIMYSHNVISVAVASWITLAMLIVLISYFLVFRFKKLWALIKRLFFITIKKSPFSKNEVVISNLEKEETEKFRSAMGIFPQESKLFRLFWRNLLLCCRCLRQKNFRETKTLLLLQALIRKVYTFQKKLPQLLPSRKIIAQETST